MSAADSEKKEREQDAGKLAIEDNSHKGKTKNEGFVGDSKTFAVPFDCRIFHARISQQ